MTDKEILSLIEEVHEINPGCIDTYVWDCEFCAEPMVRRFDAAVSKIILALENFIVTNKTLENSRELSANLHKELQKCQNNLPKDNC